MRLLFLLLLGGCVVDVNYGKDFASNWEGKGGVVDVSARYKFTKNAYCEIGHTSNLTSGPPFNKNYENHVTRFSCGREFIIGNPKWR